MKRVLIVVILVIWAISATGCTADKEVEPSSAATMEPSHAKDDEIMKKDRAITELKKERDALQDKVAELERELAQKSAVETTPICTSVAFEQEPLQEAYYDSYQKVEMPCYTIYIPLSWSYSLKGGELEFVDDRTIVGSTEVLTYLNRSGLENVVTNHAEQIGFEPLGSIVPISGIDIEIYQIKLRWEKPAAALDPNWKYDETRVYISSKPLGVSYGFYFSTEDESAETMKKIVSSFRLKPLDSNVR
ncbi:hypothetical protein H8B09_14425 [Paenibacillus sp. PR3]|uniref:Lipoprotein n=1 Tax=Paenibacillus terricola TaxID=2763503 RepID=A0ABR8MY26_9BACL|nr:hypothetical protein [Paenibacillus terricola]MBD3919956.1 hypothetical protein [Paenibacillus terricola]